MKELVSKLTIKYLKLSNYISSFVVKSLNTKIGKLLITYSVLFFPITLLGFISSYLSLFGLIGLHLITLYLLITRTSLTLLTKKVLKKLSLNNLHIGYYCILYILTVVIAWIALLITSSGFAGWVYYLVLPFLAALILYTIIISGLKFKFGYRFIKVNIIFLIILMVFQVLLMTFNFRNNIDYQSTPFMILSTSIAMFIAPIYLLLFTIFTLFTPFSSAEKEE